MFYTTLKSEKNKHYLKKLMKKIFYWDKLEKNYFTGEQ